MSRPQANRLISKLRFNVKEPKNIRAGGPQQRHWRLQKIITGLMRHERLELKYTEGEEARGYVERLISDAIRHGDCHTPTMEMASYWITEKPIIHKLFKVLAPRYKDYTISYTKMWTAPRVLPGHGRTKCVLELRGNIYPSLGPDKKNYKNLIHNVLLKEAKKFFDDEKATKQKLAEYSLRFQGNTSVKADENTVKSDSANTVTTESETKAASIESSSSENTSSVESISEVDTQKIKTETFSSDIVKESSESQNENITLGSKENLDLDKMKIKDEELPKEK